MNSHELRLLLVLGALALPGCSAVAGRLGYVERSRDEQIVTKSASAFRSIFNRQRSDSRSSGTALNQVPLPVVADDDELASPSFFEDSVRHKIGLNVDYDLRVGTPHIDVGSLKAALEQYQMQMVAFDQQSEAVRKRNELNLKLATERQVRQILDGPSHVVQVGVQSGADVASDTERRNQVPVLSQPEPPTLADLQLLVPITLQVGGNGALENTVTRLSAKKARDRAAPRSSASGKLASIPNRVEPADVRSDALMKSVSKVSRIEDSAVVDVPPFEDEADSPPFDDSRPDALIAPPYEGAVELQQADEK